MKHFFQLLNALRALHIPVEFNGYGTAYILNKDAAIEPSGKRIKIYSGSDILELSTNKALDYLKSL